MEGSSEEVDLMTSGKLMRNDTGKKGEEETMEEKSKGKWESLKAVDKRGSGRVRGRKTRKNRSKKKKDG